jgi:hypothetical protein
MATDTIVSGGTLTLSQPLTSGTNVEFLNDAGDSGVLNLKAGAVRITTVVSGGTVSLASATIGGAIENFLPGDQITLQSLATFYTELDFAANAAAENASFANDITFAALSGDEIFILPGGTVETSVGTPFQLDGNTKIIIDEIADAVFGTAAANSTITLSFAQRTNPNSNHPFIDGVITASTAINPCFCAGTRILTIKGEIAVEALRVGDTVITHGGEERRIIWIGRRDLDVSRHPRPESVRPVIVEPEALADGVPARRLALSPDHALYMDGVLVPVRELINGRTIYPDQDAKLVRYYHVELVTHDILLAEGAAAESFLDTGHRGVFDNSGEPLELHPDLMQARREAEGCADLCLGGETLAAIRRRLAQRQTRQKMSGGQGAGR